MNDCYVVDFSAKLYFSEVWWAQPSAICGDEEGLHRPLVAELLLYSLQIPQTIHLDSGSAAKLCSASERHFKIPAKSQHFYRHSHWFCSCIYRMINVTWNWVMDYALHFIWFVWHNIWYHIIRHDNFSCVQAKPMGKTGLYHCLYFAWTAFIVFQFLIN